MLLGFLTKRLIYQNILVQVNRKMVNRAITYYTSLGDVSVKEERLSKQYFSGE